LAGGWIDRFVRVAALAKRGQRVRPAASVVKLNVGAGVDVAPGWINLDGSIHSLVSGLPQPVLAQLYRRTATVSRLLSESEYIQRLRNNQFVFHNLDHGLPFDSNTVDVIFCSHVLEHFAKTDAQRLIGEMFRVLKPGGHVRVCVPDLKKAIALYQQGAKQEALQYFFTDSRAESYDQHRYMYDYELLQGVLQSQGFIEVTECAYQVGRVPDLQLLDNRPTETLYVEATKPG
jgi:SAM-dependent methyltransferase